MPRSEMPEPPVNFVRVWREHVGWSQAQLADAIGTTTAVVSLLESGDRAVSNKWMTRMRAAMGSPASMIHEVPRDTDGQHDA